MLRRIAGGPGPLLIVVGGIFLGQRYAWVNQTVFVGQGRIYPGSSVQYRVYRVN